MASEAARFPRSSFGMDRAYGVPVGRSCVDAGIIVTRCCGYGKLITLGTMAAMFALFTAINRSSLSLSPVWMPFPAPIRPPTPKSLTVAVLDDP